MKSAEGKIEKYFVDPTSGIAHKVRRQLLRRTFSNSEMPTLCCLVFCTCSLGS